MTNFSLTIIPMCCIFIALLKNPRDLQWPLGCLFAFGLLLSVISLIYKTPDPFYFLATRQIRGKNEGFWTYIQFAPLATTGFLVGFVGFIEMHKKWFLRIGFLIASLTCLAATLSSGERASPIILGILVPLYLVYSGRIYKLFSMKIVPLYIILVIAIMFSARIINSEQGERFRERFEKMAIDDPSKRDDRLNIKGDFFSPFVKNLKRSPILGVGPANYFANNKGYYPHNMFLEIGGEEGALGLLVYFWILFRYLEGVFRLRDESKAFVLIAILTGLIFFIRTFKTGDIVGSRMFWIFAAYFFNQARIRFRKKIPEFVAPQNFHTGSISNKKLA